jgi:NAD(P)-dependent dehydrogenase (short-subunit alcohol dehydrogenase family)
MFSNKVYAITGAGAGIGRALAMALAERGAQLALSDIAEAALAQTIDRLPAGTPVRGYRVDVSDRAQVEAFASGAAADFGAVDAVINNAGTSVFGTVEHITFEELQRVLAVNLWGVVHGTKAFLPGFLAQRSGCIVNLSSVFGLVASPAQVAYNMSKFAVRALTETLWQELEGTGVRAVLVHPGGIDTDIKQLPPGLQMGDYERKVRDATQAMMTTTPAQCAQEILDGLARGDRRLLVGNGAADLFELARQRPDDYGDVLRQGFGL